MKADNGAARDRVARLLGHGRALYGQQGTATGYEDGGLTVQAWGDSGVQLTFASATEEEARDLIALWRMCSVCGEEMPANDRATRFQGRRAHAVCAMTEELRVQAVEMRGDTDRYETAVPLPMPEQHAGPLVLRHEDDKCVIGEQDCECLDGFLRRWGL